MVKPMLFTVTGKFEGSNVKRLVCADGAEQAKELVMAEFPSFTVDCILVGSDKSAPGRLLTK